MAAISWQSSVEIRYSAWGGERIFDAEAQLGRKISWSKRLLLVAYLSDIVSQLNVMNKSLHGPNIMLVDVSETACF